MKRMWLSTSVAAVATAETATTTAATTAATIVDAKNATTMKCKN